MLMRPRCATVMDSAMGRPRPVPSLARPSGDPERSALTIAGDDLDAKVTISRLLDEIGYDVVDLGPLAEWWRVQPDTPAYGLMYCIDPTDWSKGARPAGAATVSAAAAMSKR